MNKFTESNACKLQPNKYLKTIVAFTNKKDTSDDDKFYKMKEMTDASSLEGIEVWDSLKHMNIIVTLEEEFGIQISDEDLGDMLNYKPIKNTILRCIKQ